MAAEGSIFIDGRNYDITYGTNLPSGKRQLVRRMRPSQPTDPSRLGQAEWALGGKYGGYIGRSREQPDGILATDYCFPAETPVRAPSGVFAVSRRWHSGELVEIATRSGYYLSGTPEHPVFTERGWVPLGLLDVGDNILHDLSRNHVTGRQHPDNENRELPIGEVYRLAKHASFVTATDGPRLAELSMEFNADRLSEEINVVAVDGLLRSELNACFRKLPAERYLSASDQVPVYLSSTGETTTLTIRSARSRSASMDLVEVGGSPLRAKSVPVGSAPYLAEGRTLFWSPSRLAEDGSVPLVPEHPPISEAVGQSWQGDTNIGCDESGWLAETVALDDVISIKRRPFSGHVFNLRTESHTYFAGGILAHNCDNIDTMWDDLLTASPAPNNVTLSSDDPSSSASARYGGFKYGAAKYQGGTAGSTAGNATHADMQAGYLFIGRGPFDTQVDSSFSVVNTAVLDSIIAGKANWQGFGWVGLGAGAALKKRTGVTSTQATYTDVTIGGSNIYAGALQRGNDRLWFVDPQNNQARYTFDAFITQSNPFTVGDDGKELTGIGTLGPYTVYGALDGLFGFTDSGKPVLVDDLEGEDSPNNGLRHASLWGWLYSITDLGIVAWTPNVANPVGIESLQEFDGPIDGRPTAIWSWRKQLFVAYLTTAGHTYILRGVYGPATESTGEPRWYPFKYMASTQCDLLYSTPRAFATNPRILVGRGTNATTYIMGRRGRDIADSNYTFSTEGGTWYGTRMTRAQHLHKYLRWASFWTEQCSASKTWQLAVSCDEGSYVNVGPAISQNGHQIVRPTSGGKPLSSVTFHTLKPRLTQVNNSTTTPPQIRGKLTIVYDERPDMVEEVSASLDLNPGDWERLSALVSHESEAPVQVSLPGDSEMHYGFVTSVGPRADANPDAVESVEVGIVLWDVQ